MAEGVLRPAAAEVDLDALSANASALASMVAPAGLCAVVKADAYGHGAVAAASAALRGGATWLAVALVEEGIELRRAGIEAPVLVLSEAPADALRPLVAAGLVPTVYSREGLQALEEAAGGLSPAGRIDVHLKVDTGMHRVGAEPAAAVELAGAIDRSARLRVGGTWTHLAVADRPDDPFTATQLALFEEVLGRLHQMGIDPGVRHVANSAGALRPEARFDLVRCGIALYGYPPHPRLQACYPPLRRALRLTARVRSVACLPAGARPSYGRLRPLPRAATVANLPLGYADGVPWRLFASGAEVLVNGRRRPLAGAVTMDQMLVDCGDERVLPGDEVVLLGRQGEEEVSA
ncbi:MAG: alanine racemase, partial [Acidimicrobiales bacterium]